MVALVARRELVERARSRAFRVSLVLLLVLVVGGIVAANLLGGGDSTLRVGLAGAGSPAADQVSQQAQVGGSRVRVTMLGDRAAAERALREDRIDAALIDGIAVLVKTERSGKAARLLQSAARASAVRGALLATGLAPGRVDRALATALPRVRALDPQSAERDRDRAALIGGLVVLYIALITYGLAVASSVIEEKATRVVELLLVTVRPNALLAGKVLGVGALGLAQLLMVGVAAVATQALTSASALPGATAEAFGLTLLWFLLGYGLYAGAYALAGALVSQQEDVQSASGPITAVLVGSYFVAITAAQDPDGTLASVCAFVPPVAPMVVPARVVLGHMGGFELALAVVVALLGIAGMIRVAAIAYERAILRTGAPAKLRSVLGRTAA
ncbi:MAG: ABC transporter permease [Actinomycetota bacterium]|nr:ABC transporter permease [Actinomycetota bacterium]